MKACATEGWWHCSMRVSIQSWWPWECLWWAVFEFIDQHWMHTLPLSFCWVLQKPGNDPLLRDRSDSQQKFKPDNMVSWIRIDWQFISRGSETWEFYCWSKVSSRQVMLFSQAHCHICECSVFNGVIMQNWSLWRQMGVAGVSLQTRISRLAFTVFLS